MPSSEIHTKIPYNQVYLTDREIFYIKDVLSNGHLMGGGPYTDLCQSSISALTACPNVLLTHSCTAALEMSALLLDIVPGDEIIMPSYTFVSTANAFVLRGAIPVFVDIREDTLNIDEKLIESAITPRTRAIVVVHYAGVACEMDSIMGISKRYGIPVVEDAAQGILSSYRGRSLGTIGQFGTLSFHATKNIVAGEGGALLINDKALISKAEIIWEKGTDRLGFHRGEIAKYTWQTVGSSFLPSDILAAVLYAQLEQAKAIIERRLQIWNQMHLEFEPLEQRGLLRRPVVPESCQHNAHIYYVVLPDQIDRRKVLDSLKEYHVNSVSHYIPLHSSPAGLQYGRASGSMDQTDQIAAQMVRLPLWPGMNDTDVGRVIDALKSTISHLATSN